MLDKHIKSTILNKLDDKDLYQVILSGYFRPDETFWMNRILNKFSIQPTTQLTQPISIEQLRKYKGDQTWSEYYREDLRVIHEKNADKYLDLASCTGRLDQIILAILAGANICANNDRAVRLAARNGHQDVVKYLVSQGAPQP